MKTLLIALRRKIAWFKVRSLEIRLHDQNNAMQYVRDSETRIQISVARRITARELAKARANYIELLPVGERMTYTIA